MLAASRVNEFLPMQQQRQHEQQRQRPPAPFDLPSLQLPSSSSSQQASNGSSNNSDFVLETSVGPFSMAAMYPSLMTDEAGVVTVEAQQAQLELLQAEEEKKHAYAKTAEFQNRQRQQQQRQRQQQQPEQRPADRLDRIFKGAQQPQPQEEPQNPAELEAAAATEEQSLLNPEDVLRAPRVVQGVPLRPVPTTQFYRPHRSLRDTLFGDVWMVEARTTNATFVLKRSSLQHALAKKTIRGEQPVQEDLFTEIRIQHMLSSRKDASPYILKLLDVFYDDGWVVMVLEHLKGGEVFEHISKRVLEVSPAVREAEARVHFKQLIHAVFYIHQLGVCHQDISLENLMFDSTTGGSTIIKLIDFGAAIKVDGWNPNGEWIGKLTYMSGEVFNRGAYDPYANDIWCCGIVLFMMLVGCPAYRMPSKADPRWTMIVSGQLSDLLDGWGFNGKFSNVSIDLMQKMLLPEGQRIKMDDIIKHPFITGI